MRWSVLAQMAVSGSCPCLPRRGIVVWEDQVEAERCVAEDRYGPVEPNVDKKSPILQLVDQMLVW